MEKLITNGIKISVETFYQPSYSNPVEGKFIHAYRITIENLSDLTVQLMRRHWIITDSDGIVREVEGEGVIGRQPVLEPHELHQYVSWCNLHTGLGKMVGAYEMQNIHSGELFQVDIPAFQLVAPFQLN